MFLHLNHPNWTKHPGGETNQIFTQENTLNGFSIHNQLLKQKLMVSPACFHAFIIGSLELLHICQGGPQLLTHLLGHVKVQGVTGRPLNQKHSSIAAAASIHYGHRKKQVNVYLNGSSSVCAGGTSLWGTGLDVSYGILPQQSECV